MKIIKLTKIKKSVTRAIMIPSSRSYTNRALFIGALSPEPVKITNPLKSDDTDAMIGCLEKLGISIKSGKNFVIVKGSINDVKNKQYELNARLSGTTIRFILALLCITPGVKILQGESGLNKRPIGPLVDALQQLGAKIEYLEKNGYPPLKINFSKLKSGPISISGKISSQYISALLMILPCIPKSKIKVEGEQISKPYIDMTIDTMKTFGVEVKNNEYKSYESVSEKKYSLKKYSIEGDFSSAGYFFAVACLTKSKITLRNLNLLSVQADRKIVDVLKDMGNIVHYHKNSITIEGKGVRPVSVNMVDFPDQAQTLAVLGAFAQGVTRLSGIQSLRIKETDRLHALMTELKKMNIRTELKRNTLIIHGGSPKSARIKTYGDHRMAMAFAIAGAKINGMEIENGDVVSKTFPTFWKVLSSLSMGVLNTDDRNIVLIGMRGSGKSTVMKTLARKMNLKCLDTDDMITTETGMSILEIVEKNDWKYFRNIESEVIKGVSLLCKTVIATGGGAVERVENIEHLKKNGVFVFLNAKVDTLISRNKKLSKKPRLTNAKTIDEEIAIILKQRINVYKKWADTTVSVDGKTPNTIADEIITKLKNINI